MSYVYKHGLPFGTVLAKNIDEGLLRVKLKKATCIIIDGGVGEGKTTLAVEVGDYINKKNGLPEIDLSINGNTQVAMGGKDFAKKIRLCYEQGKPVIIYDEAGDYARKQAITSFNAFLNRIFETYRAFKIVVIICLPNQYILDNTLFDNKIPRLLLHLKDRNEHHGLICGYSLHRAFFIRGLMRKIEDKNFAYKANEPNFYASFLDLPPERAKQLDALTIKGKLAILKTQEARIGNLLSTEELASKLGIALNTLRNKLSNLRIKPAEKIGANAYYDKNVYERLIEMQKYKSVKIKEPVESEG